MPQVADSSFSTADTRMIMASRSARELQGMAGLDGLPTAAASLIYSSAIGGHSGSRHGDNIGVLQEEVLERHTSSTGRLCSPSGRNTPPGSRQNSRFGQPQAGAGAAAAVPARRSPLGSRNDHAAVAATAAAIGVGGNSANSANLTRAHTTPGIMGTCA